MQKLHLVGFTTDQKGLILSARRGARSGSFHLPLDDALAVAVEELRARQEEEAAAAEELETPARPARVESALPVREIQARLRQGRTVQDVAKAAGVDPEWVERFAPPVYAEQARVVASVRGAALRRARLGPSAHTIGEAVRRNLVDRGVSMSPEEVDEAWTARQLSDGRWAVRFRYHHRNKDHTLRFDLEDASGTVTAADRPSSQVGYVAPPPGGKPEPRARAVDPVPVESPSAPKRATVATGFRPEPPTRAVSRPARERERANAAMTKAAARRAVDAERATARVARERAAAEARRQKEATATAARQERERAAAERAKATAAKKKAAEAKKRAAERARKKAEKQAAAQARRAEQALAAAERAAARKKADADAQAAKQAPPKAPAAQKRAKAAAKKPATTKKSARTAATRSPAAKTPSPKAAKRPAAKARSTASPPAATKAPARRAAPRASAKPRTPTPPAATNAVAAAAPRPARVVVLEDIDQQSPSLLPERPRFHAGLVEAAESGEAPVDAEATSNGARGARPLGRPRRTRPLRAST